MSTPNPQIDRSDHLLEQYKLYVQTAENVSQRRQQTNRFYISLLSGLIAILALVMDKDNAQIVDLQIVTLLISVMGIIISIVWNLNINSYRQLNTGKFKVIHELEEKLPYACFDKEWEFLGQGANSKKYLQLTKVERWIPIIFSIPYWLLLIYTLVQFMG